VTQAGARLAEIPLDNHIIPVPAIVPAAVGDQGGGTITKDIRAAGNSRGGQTKKTEDQQHTYPAREPTGIHTSLSPSLLRGFVIRRAPRTANNKPYHKRSSLFQSLILPSFLEKSRNILLNKIRCYNLFYCSI
jgi:hypothetical protein